MTRMKSNFRTVFDLFRTTLKRTCRANFHVGSVPGYGFQPGVRVSFKVALFDLEPGPAGECALKLRSLYVPSRFRGQGYGSRALRCLMKAADAAGITIYLLPTAYGSGAVKPSTEALDAWYRRHGWIPTGRRGKWSWFLVRSPGAESIKNAKKAA